MAARPAPDKDASQPARPPARPPPQPGPKRKDDLPITESLLFPRIHYHQCPAVCVCRGGEERPRGGRARARAAGGRRAAPAPGLGAPSAARGTSPLLAPAVPGHLPPSLPLRVGRGRGANYRAAARAGGRGATGRVPVPARGERTPPAPSLLLLRRRRRLPSSPPPPPPGPSRRLLPAATAAAAPPTTSGLLGRSRLRESSAVSATPPPPHPARLANAAFGKPRLVPALLFLRGLGS